ncbi:universal stress protein [Gryllotalpicola ginsengisoli]|uniref:universal stress protein n=1 Tax=Gryllotalpicola ginsengisoli TaxID=444608 RepID=UPI0003B480E9|nr:universal stress protein [Gryllotalpicola ginsengisoli]
MSDQPAHGSCLVVGVVTGREHQPDHVVQEAALLARKLGDGLVIATVDPARYEVRRNPDGSVVAFDIDPDLGEEVREEFDASAADHLASLVEPTGVPYSLRALAGEPATELAALADEVDADAIVVGTRKPGLRTGAYEFFNGSVAVHLAHRQHRPVIVIPLDPVAPGEKLPWHER